MNRRTFLAGLAPLTTLLFGAKSNSVINSKEVYKWKEYDDNNSINKYKCIKNNDVELIIFDGNFDINMFYSVVEHKRNMYTNYVHHSIYKQTLEEAKQWCEETYEKYFKNTENK